MNFASAGAGINTSALKTKRIPNESLIKKTIENYAREFLCRKSLGAMLGKLLESTG